MTLDEFMNKEFIGEGEYAKCYSVGKDNVLKVFKNPLPIDRVDKFKYFLNYSNDSFVFPFEFMCSGEEFNGYITKRVYGKALKDVFYSISLEQLSNHSLKLEKDIDFVSSGLIVTNDLSSNNILYDGTKFKVIDPDFYNKDSDLSIEEVKKLNSQIYRTTIGKLFIVPYLTREKQQNYVVDRARYYIQTNINVSEFILQMKEELEKYYKEKITKLEDLDSILRR